MTSTHSINPGRRRAAAGASRSLLRLCAILGFMMHCCGCTGGEKITPPMSLSTPYEREVLWAVVPFTNESGVSEVDGSRIADLFTEQAQQVQGVNTIPVNRVILAMRQLDMGRVATPGDAMTLMNTLGIDGVIVGTITAFDPYPPLKLGAAVQLYTRDTPERSSIDPVEVSRAATEKPAAGEMGSPHPVAQAAGVFNADNHQTLAWLDEYATGRSTPQSAYGKDIYLVKMELYTQFVAHRLIDDLLADERTRLSPPAEPTDGQTQQPDRP